jgi:hypothetical protein
VAGGGGLAITRSSYLFALVKAANGSEQSCRDPASDPKHPRFGGVTRARHVDKSTEERLWTGERMEFAEPNRPGVFGEELHRASVEAADWNVVGVCLMLRRRMWSPQWVGSRFMRFTAKVGSA